MDEIGDFIVNTIIVCAGIFTIYTIYCIIKFAINSAYDAGSAEAPTKEGNQPNYNDDYMFKKYPPYETTDDGFDYIPRKDEFDDY